MADVEIKQIVMSGATVLGLGVDSKVYMYDPDSGSWLEYREVKPPSDSSGSLWGG